MCQHRMDKLVLIRLMTSVYINPKCIATSVYINANESLASVKLDLTMNVRQL